MTGYVINKHNCLKNINCNVYSYAKLLPVAISKLNPFNAVFICADIVRIFSWQYVTMAMYSSSKRILQSAPGTLVVAYVGDFVQSKAAFEFTAQ